MAEMDNAAFFGRAWQWIKSNRALWALGFIAALSGDLLSNIRIGPELNLMGTGELLLPNRLDVNAWLRALRLLGGSLVVAAAIAAAAGIVMLLLVLAAKAGLVQAAAGSAAGSQQPGGAGQVGSARAALRAARPLLGSLVEVTVLAYGPYLLASELAGEALPFLPGLARVPLYVVLVALVFVGLFLPFYYTFGICAVVRDGCAPREALYRARQSFTELRTGQPVVLLVLLAANLVCGGLARLLLQPVAGASLLAFFLTALRGTIPDPGQTLGLLVLGILSTAVLAVATLFDVVVLALFYERAGGHRSAGYRR